jgi:copper chaperone CopZ
MSVAGMTCSDCANSAEKLLRKLAGVVNVDASFAASRVVVRHDAFVVAAAQLVERLAKLKFTGTVTTSVVDGSSEESAAAEERQFVVLVSAANRKTDYTDVMARMRRVRGVKSVDIDNVNGRASVHIESNVKRRDVLDAFGAAGLPSAIFDAQAAAAAVSEASEQRELRRSLMARSAVVGDCDSARADDVCVSGPHRANCAAERRVCTMFDSAARGWLPALHVGVWRAALHSRSQRRLPRHAVHDCRLRLQHDCLDRLAGGRCRGGR